MPVVMKYSFTWRELGAESEVPPVEGVDALVQYLERIKLMFG